jgi:hypothetical protein
MVDAGQRLWWPPSLPAWELGSQLGSQQPHPGRPPLCMSAHKPVPMCLWPPPPQLQVALIQLAELASEHGCVGAGLGANSDGHYRPGAARRVTVAGYSWQEGEGPIEAAHGADAAGAARESGQQGANVLPNPTASATSDASLTENSGHTIHVHENSGHTISTCYCWVGQHDAPALLALQLALPPAPPSRRWLLVGPSHGLAGCAGGAEMGSADAAATVHEGLAPGCSALFKRR